MRAAAGLHNQCMQRTIFGLTITVLSLAGCGVKFGGNEESSGDVESSSGETSSGTVGNSSAPTAADPTEQGTTAAATLPDGTTVAPDGTTGSITQPTSATETFGETEAQTVTTLDPSGFTTGVVEPSSCELLCQHAVECEVANDLEVCVSLCSDLAEAPGACGAASEVVNACFIGLSCEHLGIALNGGLAHPCSAEQLDRQEACGSLECDTGGGGDIGGTECELELLCGIDPLRRMECDAEQCVCIVDGQQVGSCAADGVCDDLQSLSEKGISCCEFPDPGF